MLNQTQHSNIYKILIQLLFQGLSKTTAAGSDIKALKQTSYKTAAVNEHQCSGKNKWNASIIIPRFLDER